MAWKTVIGLQKAESAVMILVKSRGPAGCDLLQSGQASLNDTMITCES